MSNRPVTLAQIGIGYWGKNLLRNFSLLDGVEVKYICDVREEVTKQFGAIYPHSIAIQDYDRVLADESVEAVVISTETPLHFPMAKQALLSGKHVYVEKPMTQTPAEAEELVKIAEDKDRRLMVGHLLLYHPAFCYLEDAIERKLLGDVYYMHSTRVNLGIIRQKENAFESLAPHDLAVALKYMATDPVAISATGQSYLQPNIEDIVFATVFFEGGKLAHLHTSWLDPLKVRKLTVVGSSKMAVIDDMQPDKKVTLYDKGVDRIVR